MSDHEHLVWDWNQHPENEIIKTMRRMGLHVYKDPNWAGSTSRGIVISKEKLDKKQIRKICKGEK